MIKETAIKGFTNEDFGTIRSVVIDDIPWFVGKDVATILGYAKPRNAIAAHVDEEDRKDASIQGDLGGAQMMTIINESGLYSLILSSELPTAKKFKRWVTSEVLPAIRQNGGYFVNDCKKYTDNNLTYASMQQWKYNLAYPIMNQLCTVYLKESREILDFIYAKMEEIGEGTFYKTIALNNFVKVDDAPRCLINAIAENEIYKKLYLRACRCLAQQRVDELANLSVRIFTKIDNITLGCEGLE